MKAMVSVILLILSFNVLGQEAAVSKKVEADPGNEEKVEASPAVQDKLVVSASEIDRMLSIKGIKSKQELMSTAFSSNRSLALASFGFSLTILLGGAIFVVVNHGRLDKLVDSYSKKLEGIEETETRLKKKVDELDEHKSVHMAFGDLLTSQGLIARLSSVMINLTASCDEASKKEMNQDVSGDLKMIHERIYEMCREIHEVGSQALMKLQTARRELKSVRSSTVATGELEKHICIELARIHTLNALAYKRLWGISSSETDLLKATDEIKSAEQEAKKCENESLLAKVKYNYACYLNLSGNQSRAEHLLREACELESRYVNKAKTDPDLKRLVLRGER